MKTLERLKELKEKHETKPFSGMEDIPSGKAGENLIHACLVLEGGGFRGLYTQGFLDAMMVHDLNLDCVIGVSAGALAGMNYVAGQIGRSARVNLGYRHDSRYVGARALLHSRSFLDVGFLTEDRGIIEPLDSERFYRPERRFIAVAANCQTGQVEYFEKGKCYDIASAVRASATLPYISPMVMIGGVPYLDGGCVCKVPYEWALNEGYEKIVVIRTRDVSYRRKEEVSGRALRFYRRYPEFAERLSVSSMMNNRQFDEIERLHEEGRLLRIAPSAPVEIGRVEKDVEKLGDLYFTGYTECLDQLESLKEYLGVQRDQQPGEGLNEASASNAAL
ncbi:MAG: patatin family protein [Lachnospiraceae bacterium]|nr:patatin family protein [Lachnospiraceae bacterium]